MDANEQTKELAVVQETEVAVVQQAPTQKINILMDNGVGLNDLFKSGRLEELSTMEKNPLNLAMQYFDFSQNKPERFFFAGLTESPTESGELLPAAVLINKDGDPYVNQGTLLVEAFRKNNIPMNTPVEVTWTGTKKTGNGNQVRTWRVNLLR